MKLIAAPTHEQGQDFVVVLVKDQVIQDPNESEAIIRASQREFGVRAALIGERRHETRGPRDIVNWLEGVAFDQLPWQLVSSFHSLGVFGEGSPRVAAGGGAVNVNQTR